MMIFFIIQFSQAYSYDIYSSQRTNELIKFVKQQESCLFDVQSKVNVLKDRFIGEDYGRHYRSYDPDNFYFKWPASKNDLKKIHDLHQQVFNRTQYLKEQIENLLDDREFLYEVDKNNHTALYYAQTSEMYNALRSSGAQFEVVPFLYIYRWYTIPATMALVFIIYTLYEVGYFSIDQCIKYSQKIYDGTLSTIDDIKKVIYAKETIVNQVEVKKNNYNVHDMQSRDDQGRTPLMSYVIEQENTLVALREKIDILWSDDKTEWDDYIAEVFRHKAICHQTQMNIKSMVELGAIVDIQDLFGKTLLDYCFTKDIYESLLGIGVPFQINSWIYFNYDYYVKKAPIVVPVLTIVTLCTAYKTMQIGMNFKNDRDVWFERWAARNL